MRESMDNQLSLFDVQPEIPCVDFTRINTFRRCPLEYKYRFKPRNPKYDPQGLEIHVARSLHSVASRFLALSEKERTKKQMANMLDSILSTYARYFGDNAHEKTKDITDTLFKLRQSPIARMKTQAVELRFRRQSEDLVLTGRVDYIGKDDDGHILVDFKLDQSEFIHYQGDVERYLQLIFYYYGVSNVIRLEGLRLGHYFFQTGHCETIIANPDLLKNGFERIRFLYQQSTRMTEFAPEQNPFCGTCRVRYFGNCPIWAHRR